MPSEQAIDRPPYISFTTLINFLDRLGAGPIPPRIDKSGLDSYSGGVQAILMATLRSMNFVTEEGGVTQALREAAQDESARKAHLELYARSAYSKQLALAQANGTAQMLQESFQEYGFQGSTLRKAIVFFLAMVEYLDLPRSPHFRAPRQPPTGAGTRKRRARVATPTPSISAPTPPQAPSLDGEVRTIQLGPAGTVTLAVNVKWLDLDDSTFTSLRQLIRDMESLGTGEKGDADQ